MSNEIYITNATVLSDYEIMENVTIRICGDKIGELSFSKAEDGKASSGTACKNRDAITINAQGYLTCAGLIDTHIHGIGGFGTEDSDPESIKGMSQALTNFGVTSFFPTLYPNSKKMLFDAEEAIASAAGGENGARILGMHIEGPFVSPDKSGALPKSSLSEIDMRYFGEIIKHGHGLVKCMTVAPELDRLETLARRCEEEGITLLAGHTNATFEQMEKSIGLGIRHCTHFFNAMSPLHHRKPGAVGAILAHPETSCEIIADGVHVHPSLVKLTTTCKANRNIVLVTDSLKPNHQPDGRLFANGVEVVLSANGAFVSKENPLLLNGSALTLNKAVSNLYSWGIKKEIAAGMAAASPASVYHLEGYGSVKEGYKADICIFDESFNARTVIVNGRLIANTL